MNFIIPERERAKGQTQNGHLAGDAEREARPIDCALRIPTRFTFGIWKRSEVNYLRMKPSLPNDLVHWHSSARNNPCISTRIFAQLCVLRASKLSIRRLRGAFASFQPIHLIRIRLAKICRRHEAFPDNPVEHFLTSVRAAFSSNRKVTRFLSVSPDRFSPAVYLSRLFLTRLVERAVRLLQFLGRDHLSICRSGSGSLGSAAKPDHARSLGVPTNRLSPALFIDPRC